jgi:hypothetical protein
MQTRTMKTRLTTDQRLASSGEVTLIDPLLLTLMAAVASCGTNRAAENTVAGWPPNSRLGDHARLLKLLASPKAP